MQLFHSIHKAGGETVIDEVVYVNLTTCACQHLAVAQYYARVPTLDIWFRCFQSIFFHLCRHLQILCVVILREMDESCG
jgi:hypothetical protein